LKVNLRALPDRISKDIFNSYYYCRIDQDDLNTNTGIVVDDGLFEFIFLKENDIQIEANGKKMALPQAFIIGKVDFPSRFIIPNSISYFTIKIQP